MLRRAALYGAPTSGAGWQKCYSALSLALETRFGPNRTWRRSTRFIEKEDVADDVAVAIVLGTEDCSREYAKRSVDLGIPTLVIDQGWLRLERGYWQVSQDWLNTPPPRAPDRKRFDSLNLKAHPPVERDYHTVILGEVAGDARHDLQTDSDVVKWALRAGHYVKNSEARRRVFWRPDPRFVQSLGSPTILTNHGRLLSSLINDDLVGSAVVYNSPLGVDLLRQGVHVVAQGPRTVYTDLVPSDISLLHRAHPGPEKVEELLIRLAYGQYQINELSEWNTFERLLDLYGKTGDW